jgi:hypothetical protein
VSAALTPESAIAYVRELSADVRAAVVLSAAGRRLAGAPELEEPARRFLAAAGPAGDVAHRTPDGVVIAARTPTHAIVVCAGPLSLIGPTACDARAAAEALEAAGAREAIAESTGAPGPPPESLEAAAKAVISAT